MAEQMTSKDWYRIFDLALEKPDIEIKDAEKILDKHRTTVGRALRIAKYLIERGTKPLDEEIAELIAKNVGYGTTIKFVNGAYYHYLNWRDDYSTKELLKRLHLNTLLSQVSELCSCLEHPTLNDLPERELLEVRGYDWRLDPMMWFYLCTPSFSRKDLWGSEFPKLESHMKESPFWEHLEQLKQAVKALEKDYDGIARTLFKDDQRFEEFWKSIQLKRLERETDWGYKPSRTLHTPEPEPEDLKLYYDQEYAKEVMKRFIDIANDLPLRQFELEKMLDQLYIDLLPDEINPIIVKGHCEKCP